MTAASAKRAAIQAGLPIRRTTAGVIAAATSTPSPLAAKTWPSPASSAWKKPWSTK